MHSPSPFTHSALGRHCHFLFQERQSIQRVQLPSATSLTRLCVFTLSLSIPTTPQGESIHQVLDHIPYLFCTCILLIVLCLKQTKKNTLNSPLSLNEKESHLEAGYLRQVILLVIPGVWRDCQIFQTDLGGGRGSTFPESSIDLAL